MEQKWRVRTAILTTPLWRADISSHDACSHTGWGFERCADLQKLSSAAQPPVWLWEYRTGSAQHHKHTELTRFCFTLRRRSYSYIIDKRSNIECRRWLQQKLPLKSLICCVLGVSTETRGNAMRMHSITGFQLSCQRGEEDTLAHILIDIKTEIKTPIHLWTWSWSWTLYYPLFGCDFNSNSLKNLKAAKRVALPVCISLILPCQRLKTVCQLMSPKGIF